MEQTARVEGDCFPFSKSGKLFTFDSLRELLHLKDVDGYGILFLRRFKTIATAPDRTQLS